MKKNIFAVIGSELLDFFIVVLAVAILWMLFLYNKAIFIWADDMFAINQDYENVNLLAVQGVFSQDNQWSKIDANFLDTNDLDAIFAELTTNTNSPPELRMHDYLADKINHYDFAFNDLPPGRRLVASSIWVDTPIQDVEYASDEKLQNGDFDEELRQWIVKYPFTSTPGEEGNSLLFGHSTVSAREDNKNPFWYVFYKLPKMEQWDEFQVIRDGQLYTYQVQEKSIQDPKDVWEEIEKYDLKWKHHLTLMACYPLFSDLNRILVRAELVQNPWWVMWNIFSIS